MGQLADILRIQRFSINDGPGIRTTVFFKGCPMRCRWCHNPDSISRRPQLMLSHKLCTSCGKCAEVYPELHRIVDGKHIVHFDKFLPGEGCADENRESNVRSDIVRCGEKSVEACSSGALSIQGSKMSVERIMEVVAADKHYYAESGGGITA